MTTMTVATKYYGPTDTRGSRIRVEYLDGSNTKVWAPFDYFWSNPHTGALYDLHPGATVEYIGEMSKATLYRVTTNEGE